MRICLIARNEFVADPRARALHASLTEAGHEVRLVAAGRRSGASPAASTYTPTRRPVGGGLVGRVLRRLQPDAVRAHILDRKLAAAAREWGPDIIYPTTVGAVRAAVEAAGNDAAVVRDPRWPDPGPRDLVWLSPDHPELATPPPGPGLPFHTPGDDRPPWWPDPGRYRGRRIAIAYPKSDSNPGRYLEQALRRAGFEVLLFTRQVDTSELPQDLAALVFVEGPYPALKVTGPPVGFPVIFWVHHGEHHLAANLRMARRYRADAVLLAHSWHLAHRFSVPVHRFPFGIDEELFDPSRPWDERRFDAAMIGAHLREGGPYQRRQELVRTAETTVGADRTAFLEGVSPERMAEIYADARVVLNEGGTRHFPITMRVFEAIAAGALLLTDPVPGLAQLFADTEEFRTIEPDLGAQLTELLTSAVSAQVAAAALHRAQGRHTYDHRVDELIELLAVTEPGRAPETAAVAADAPSRTVAEDVEVQRILTDESWLAPEHLPDREIWRLEELRGPVKPASFEAIAADLERVDEDLLDAGRRYLYLTGPCRGLEDYLARRRPAATIAVHGDVRRVDLGTEGYRRRQPEETRT